MLIEIVGHAAGQHLLSALEHASRNNISLGILHFRSGALPQKFSEETILAAINPVLNGRKSSLYLIEDGDLVVTWLGMHRATLEGLCDALYGLYKPDTDERTLHTYFDAVAHGESARLLCRAKAELSAKAEEKNAKPNMPQKAKSPSALLPATLELNPLSFKAALARRASRKQPVILVVEDQLFSRKLLLGLLDRTYHCLNAATVAQGLDYYLGEAPDILFLDIDLPDGSGHELAATVNALDPDAYVVIVSGNNGLDDVAQAKANRAKGFIVKPYSRQKIMAALERFTATRKV